MRRYLHAAKRSHRVLPAAVRSGAQWRRSLLMLGLCITLLAATGGEIAWSAGGGGWMILAGCVAGGLVGVGVVWGVGVGVLAQVEGREERIREQTERLRFYFLDAHALMCERSEGGYALDVSYARIARESLSEEGEVLERIETELFGVTTIQLGHLEAELDEVQIAMSLERLVDEQGAVELVREHAPDTLLLVGEEISLPGWIRVTRGQRTEPGER